MQLKPFPSALYFKSIFQTQFNRSFMHAVPLALNQLQLRISFKMFVVCKKPNTDIARLYRCTDPDQRTFALGVQMIIWRLLGSIPGPVIFGLAIDNACSLWQTTNGGVGSCQVYDNYSFSRYVQNVHSKRSVSF